MYNNAREGEQNAPLNTIASGAAILTPYVYFGNLGGLNDNPASRQYGKSSPENDEAQNTYLENDFSVASGAITPTTAPWALENFDQCLKRYQIEVNWFKSSPGERDTHLVPEEDPYFGPTPRSWEAAMWSKTAAQRIKTNFLLDFDTLDLYEPYSDILKLGRKGTSASFTKGPFTARGLPIKFQKVYFYGTKGNIKDLQYGNSRTRAMGLMSQSDGRGTLFSTYILTATAPVNSLGEGYTPDLLEDYSNFKGGTFSFPTQQLSQENQYDQGIDVEWDIGGNVNNAPLIIGDGALGFREATIGEEIFGKVDIYEVTHCAPYYKQSVALCIDDPSGEGQINVSGSILFQPDTAFESYFSESDKRMVIHDMRNTFSCSGIVPTGACWNFAEAGTLPACPSILPYQNQNVQILKNTDILIKVSPDSTGIEGQPLSPLETGQANPCD